jgi:hypothetical protein
MYAHGSPSFLSSSDKTFSSTIHSPPLPDPIENQTSRHHSLLVTIVTMTFPNPVHPALGHELKISLPNSETIYRFLDDGSFLTADTPTKTQGRLSSPITQGEPAETWPDPYWLHIHINGLKITSRMFPFSQMLYIPWLTSSHRSSGSMVRGLFPTCRTTPDCDEDTRTNCTLMEALPP